MRAWCVVLALGGCYSPSAPTGAPCTDDTQCPSSQRCIDGFCGGGGPGGATDDAAADTLGATLDAEPDAPALCTTWTAEHFDPCAIPPPLGDVSLVSVDNNDRYDLDTDDGTLVDKDNAPIAIASMVVPQTDGPELMIVSVSSLTIADDVTLDVRGDRSLLIAVWDTATIAGVIDVSAAFTSEGNGGAGGTTAIAAFCGGAPTGNSGAAGTPATGGGGGAFQGNGGRGGNSSGGAGLAIAVPTIVRGGCAGGPGGASTAATTGTRGAGGGAIEIAARTSITITSTGIIEASGGAGRGGPANFGGGGGGGAGGYIGLDAPNVVVAGILAANGGSSGGGASDSTAGTNGIGGLRSASQATGGAGAATSTVGTCIKGGNGSGGGILNGATAGTSPCGGGGGGGGAGYILIQGTPTVTGTVSPAAIAYP